MVGHQDGHLLLRLMYMEVREGGGEKERVGEWGREGERERASVLGSREEVKYLHCPNLNSSYILTLTSYYSHNYAFSSYTQPMVSHPLRIPTSKIFDSLFVQTSVLVSGNTALCRCTGIGHGGSTTSVTTLSPSTPVRSRVGGDKLSSMFQE